MYVYNEIETLPREKLRKLQDERLRSMVAYVYERVPFYRDTFGRAGLKPDDIRSVEDLPKLPFTRKQDLKEHYPFGLLAVPREQTVRIHAVAARQERLPSSATPVTISIFSPKSWPVRSSQPALAPVCSCTTPMATASSPAASAFTMEANAWA